MFSALASFLIISTLWTTSSSMPANFDQAARSGKAVIKRTKSVLYWPEGKVPYTISSLLSQPARKVVEQAIKMYRKKTCVTFEKRFKQKNYVSFVPGQGCYSAVGMQGGRQEITISSRCETKGTILHEIMHALGFHHEHSRFDRDNYVNILWWNVQPGAEKNFEVNSLEEQNTFNLPYDYDSILHYNKKAYSKNGEDTIQANYDPDRQLGSFGKFSSLDIEKLKYVYPCPEKGHAPKEEEKKCKDIKEGCAKFASFERYCQENKHMKIYCRKTCEFC
uniref:Metalloendopeptidase n=1 Tax=Isarachnanthus nocturnus TaxID=1240238 RepID=A0A7G7WYS0_9CNID|nr:toxin candidate TRINITY_DN16695_c0_g1_i1 [Isarachnanthus nocturnus]